MFFIYFIFLKKWFGLRRSRANELVFAYLLSILPLRKIQYTSWISHMVIDWTHFPQKRDFFSYFQSHVSDWLRNTETSTSCRYLKGP